MLKSELIRLLAQKTGTDNFLQYSISPFQHKHATEFGTICKSSEAQGLSEPIVGRFVDKYPIVTESGRAALELALAQLNLDSDDEVWIETTTNNFYISGCVTRTIEKFCKWSRQRSEKTKVILINHEFGFPVDNISSYRRFQLPIIEDCAFSFLSDNADRTVGKYADFVIVSFPKFLPVPWGGALYTKSPLQFAAVVGPNPLVALVNHYANHLDRFRRKRLSNYESLKQRFLSEGLDTTFDLASHHTPGVFMFNMTEAGESLGRIKQELNGAGIQSSVFYGRNAYFIPCHHELNDFDLEYLAEKTITTVRKQR
jgi:dTDP-4-amino-4,6-dideoxygalactose transaminase